ncbi:DUF3846 domain-containing protein [Streptomyces nanhaiensis]|uniref:DUF3846 domain-containing protein n=1 Tax=Streptomyces nanhaiensis TaxID=679319 RepID=UPI00399C8FBC
MTNAVLITNDSHVVPLTLPAAPDDRLTVMNAVLGSHGVEAADLTDHWTMWVDESSAMYRRPVNALASAVLDRYGVPGGICGPALITGRSRKGTCPLDADGVAAVLGVLGELSTVEWGKPVPAGGSDQRRQRYDEAVEKALPREVQAEEWAAFRGTIGLGISDTVMAVAEAETAELRACLARQATSIRELAQTVRDAEAALDRVRALHVRNQNTGDCEHCSERDYPNYAVPWPCPTIRALDGSQP